MADAKARDVLGDADARNGRTAIAAAPSEIAVLYKEYVGPLTASLTKAFGSGPPDPEDISHLAFQKVIERGDITSIKYLKSFLYRTAYNLLLNEKRRQGVRERNHAELEHLNSQRVGDGSSPESALIAREQISEISEVLEKMHENRRLAFMLYRFDGLSVAEIGRRLGISRPAAAKHIAKAISEIDGLFDDDNEQADASENE